MNKLEQVILEQQGRVRDAGPDPLEALSGADEEIMGVATPELTLEILTDLDRTMPPSVRGNGRVIPLAYPHPASILSRSDQAIKSADIFARMKMLAPNQGYVGGILDPDGSPIIFGNSAIFGKINQSDPVQDAMDYVFYPPKIWVKALRAEAYKHRPDSARNLSIARYLASLGLTLGAIVNSYGDIIGATGFMPGERLLGISEKSAVNDQVNEEEVAAFRLSGLCDQAVLDPFVFLSTDDFAELIIREGGTIN